MELLDVREASRRLGVRPQTLYAYVSRGIVASHRRPGTRTSWFTAADIDRLARRGRPRRATQRGAMDLTIETSITQISDLGLRYRGRDVAVLATTATFEEVAALLWRTEPRQPWTGTTIDLNGMGGPAGVRRVCTELTRPTEPAYSVGHPPSPASVADDGAYLIASIVDSLPIIGESRTPRLHVLGRPPLRGSIAGRLWPRLTRRRAHPTSTTFINAAMVLAADHELAASTLAVRVAASTWAPPAAAALAGLGAMAGPLHGSASAAAAELLAEALEHGPRRTVSLWLDSGRRLPGFGHKIYVGTDPRAVVLLDMLRLERPSRTLHVVDGLIDEVHRRIGQHPNLDLALAAMSTCYGMAADAGEVLMSTARVAGWLAHAMEEYQERPLRFRTRAAFTPTSG